ncbi:hypothetical protein ACFS5L_35295 [Streptomyces phyllanthi]|uniref:Uncharacterized protein n=1 Tax=Streptomyces phyllanthi TaxID=1803180 RepID=A0A5N8WGU8_9ACTN|nr:hypothetical protein [Streptomyces phyllanthi]MPY45718.1 hypothetical protein [Streptomyces phyllanthi]
MDIERYLATIDQLCSRPFPAEHGWSDVGPAGPGYFVAELEMSHGLRTADAVERFRTAADFHDVKEGMSQRLNTRWGRQQPPWGTVTLRVRIDRGEEIPEPWATVSHAVDELDVWQADGTGRWIAVGVADRDQEDEIRLLAVVTETAQP